MSALRVSRLWPILVVLGMIYLSYVFFSIHKKERLSADAPEENRARLSAFWLGENPLYYLDLSGRSPIAFVLPKKAATLARDARVAIEPEAIVLQNGKATLRLTLDEAPPAKGVKRCMTVEHTKLCEAEKEKP